MAVAGPLIWPLLFLETTIFTPASTQRWGAHIGEPGPEQKASSTSTAWNSRQYPWVCVTTGQPRLPGHDCYGQHHGSALYQQAGRDTVLLPTSSSSGPIPVATLTGHSPPGQTHSRLFQCDPRPSVQPQSSDNHGMESPSRDVRL